jgi:hypothetical protein
MGNKRMYFLSILYIAAYAVVIKFVYPELEITALATIIPLLGFASALVTNYLLPKPRNNQGDNDE